MVGRLSLYLRIHHKTTISDPSYSSCRCAFTSMYVPIAIKRKSGRVIKSWEVNGAHNIEEVLQFIWRDLFLSLLATGTKEQIAKIPEMLDDIEDMAE